jgi:ubiquinone/menaquinone biosynthesis C-methylase UbiE
MTDIIRQQIEYYRARANEYDEWFYRIGRYDRGEELNKQWFDEVGQVAAALRALGHQPRVLELACGTGIWTQELAAMAGHVTALDASEEVIAINRSKLAEATNVDYFQANLFQWEPDEVYDLVFFGFWLSHVPPEKLDDFLAKVARSVRPGGRMFMVDSRRDPTSTASDQVLPENSQSPQMTRRLNDGREFTIIKIYYDPADLQGYLERAGFQAEVDVTPRYCIYAVGTK